MIYGQEHSKCQYTEAGGNILFSPRNLSSQKVALGWGGCRKTQVVMLLEMGWGSRKIAGDASWLKDVRNVIPAYLEHEMAIINGIV